MPRNSQTEEPDWYASAEGRRQTQREFERALKNGTVIRSAGSSIQRTNPKVFEKLLEQAKINATRPVSIRLSIADIELAKSIASKRGIGYQTVLKQAMRKGLHSQQRSH
jgi:predicted DNA binding CopG/RHH family protein